MSRNLPILGIVVPCFNEQECLPKVFKVLSAALSEMIGRAEISADSFCYFVDDGSVDNTWQQILEQNKSNRLKIIGCKLASNRGHQNALLAGLKESAKHDPDCLVSIDADLQHDVTCIPKMVQRYVKNGDQIIFAVRESRVDETLFKRFLSTSYYKVLQSCGVDAINNHADFRLIGKKVILALEEYGERHLFLRGIFKEMGYSHSIITFKQGPRFADISKYSFTRMMSLAWNGITSFSALPLRLISAIGALMFLLSTFMSLWILFTAIFTDDIVPGWASTVLPIYILGGLQLFSLGVVGEYIGKIFVEVKKRPRYLIEESV